MLNWGLAEYELVWSCVFENKCCGIIFILDLVGFDSSAISSSTFSNLFKCFVYKLGPTKRDFPNICEKFARRVFCLKLWNPGVSGAVRSEDTIGRPDDSAHHTNTIFSRIQILYFQEYKYSIFKNTNTLHIFKNINTLFSRIEIVHNIQILLILITVHTTQILRTTQYFWILMIVDTYSTADTADNTSFVH